MTVTIFVADLAEFSPLVKAASAVPDITVVPPRDVYKRQVQIRGELAAVQTQAECGARAVRQHGVGGVQGVRVVIVTQAHVSAVRCV